MKLEVLRDHEERTVLHIACIKGAKKIVKEVINLGADLMSMKDSYGHTPLEKAKLYGHSELVRRLEHILEEEQNSDFEGFTDDGDT